MLSSIHEYEKSWRTKYPDVEYFTESYSAKNQSWDAETLKELKDKYNIFYNKGCFAVKIIPRDNDDKNYLFVIGHEDDGTIYFKVNKWGDYAIGAHTFWANDLIDLLQTINKEYNNQ